MKERLKQSWVVQVVPGEGESLGHYLSRFRRENRLSHKTLSEVLGLPTPVVNEWEVPSRRRIPNTSQLEQLSRLVGIDVEQLREMLPMEPLHLATRLCPACYSETPVHRNAWQRAQINQCDRHQQPLVSSCPGCGARLRLPALWERGWCCRCWLPFSEMSLLQSRR